MITSNQILDVAPPVMEDEGIDPMAGVLDDTGPGQMAPRNMSQWIFRGCCAVLGGVYKTESASGLDRTQGSEMMRNAIIQTEPPHMKDASAMIIDGQLESERLNDLDIKIPLPAELPVLTTSQLLELERRLGDLMSRLEDEIHRAEGEIQRRKEQDAQLEKREAVMHSNRFGKWQTNSDWAVHMRNKIEQRLHKRHGFVDVPSLPTQKANLDSTLMSPLRSKRGMQHQQGGYHEDPHHSSMMMGDDGNTPLSNSNNAMGSRNASHGNLPHVGSSNSLNPSFVAFQ